jgi:hypothetical protein
MDIANQVNGMVGTSLLISGAITLLVLVIVGIVLWRVLMPILRGQKMTRDLLTNGEMAQARILRLAETGMMVNNQPVADILMEVHPQNRAPYQAQARMAISMLRVAQVQPGAVVPVRFDPSDVSKVVIDLR